MGFTWTHWLADRGVEVRDGGLDADYARQLYRDARSVLGWPGDEDTGATVASGARVLENRRLLTGCYSCPDIDSLLQALLERGPLVAGLLWQKSMFAPIDVAGWAVCQRMGGASETGGHCVLLNGVALDLTLDGVTGFVRFKNTWGTQWGDSGHAVISIEDLEAATQATEVLLPIPSAETLGHGLRQEVATDTPPYRPLQEVFAQSAIDGDSWARRDTVGAEAYAKAIARGIQHPGTEPPLTIGIKGAWGAGKTSLMRMIQSRLEWPHRNGAPGELRGIHLQPEAVKRLEALAPKRMLANLRQGSKVTNFEVLRKAKKSKASDATGPDASTSEQPALQASPKAVVPKSGFDADVQVTEDERLWRPTVWFNPWMYQTGEQIWAGLAYQIIDQITERMGAVEKERFWLHLNLERVDEQAVRRKLYGLILGRAVPLALLGMVLFFAGLALLVAGGASWIGAALATGGPATAILGTGLTALRVLASGVHSSLSGLVGPNVGSEAIAGAATNTYDEIVETPDYRADSGAFYLVQTDVKRVVDLVATPTRPLVIFVDDLDRCSPSCVVQVIEAINLFVAGDYPNTIFVIAMEPEMVAAHVEAVYGDLVQKLDQTSGVAGQAFDLGWRFLEKIVQLPLAVPALEQRRTTTLLESMFSPAAADGQPASGDQGPEKDGEAPPDRRSADASAPPVPNRERIDVVPPDAAEVGVFREMGERQLTADDPEVREAMDYATGFLARNPREIKRFVNLFRFFTMISTERRRAGMAAPDSLQAVAKLAVLGIRWPSLLSAVALPTADDDGRTIFELLENSPYDENGAEEEERLETALRAARLNETAITRLLTPDMRRFFVSAPMVGTGVRGYL